MSMTTRTTPTSTYKIWMAGNFKEAQWVCAEYCKQGMCVSIAPTNYIYTGGGESGFCVTLINYARFPCTSDEIFTKAKELGDMLLRELHQQSYSIEGPNVTHFFSTREQDGFLEPCHVCRKSVDTRQINLDDELADNEGCQLANGDWVCSETCWLTYAYPTKEDSHGV